MLKFKKTAVCALAAAILTVITGCGTAGTNSDKDAKKPATAAEIYAAALKNDKASKSDDMSMDMKMKMSYGEETVDMSMQYDLKTDYSDKDNIKMAMTGTTNIPGAGSVAVNYIFIKDVIYVDTAGTKCKAKVDLKTAEEIMNIGEDQSSAFLPDGLTDLELTKDGDDNIIKFKLNKDQLNGFMKDIVESSAGNGADINFSDMNGNMVIDSNYNVKSMNINMKATTKAEGVEMAIDMEINAKANSTGGNVKIEAPADADSYTEIDPATLTASQAA